MRTVSARRVLVAAAVLALCGATVATGQIDWGALDPALAGASYVRDDRLCADCHQEAVDAYAETRHARAFRLGGADGSCESCHGPRSKHVEDPGDEIPFLQLPPAAQSAICQQCHQGGAQLHWPGSAHQHAELSCSSCHHVMERRSDRALLAREDTTETCMSCHGEVRGQMMRPSRHPVREGRMDCASCHQPHGSTAPAMMRGNSVNEGCYSCHADKRGPYLWEHAPARESCLTCHDAHGSNHRNLLAAKDPFLCLQCHSYGGHVNLPRYDRVSNPYGSGCVNCHTSVHGSNHPSGAKLTR
jgi:DmsE family decaheme c-type cytochrome